MQKTLNRDDIIRMAREAMSHTSIEPNDKVTFYVAYNNGVDADGFCDSVETFIERFANLVAAAEREACAKVCEEWLHGEWHNQGVIAALMIRERGAP